MGLFYALIVILILFWWKLDLVQSGLILVAMDDNDKFFSVWNIACVG